MLDTPSAEKVVDPFHSILGLLDSKQSYSDLMLVANEPVMLRNASGWFESKNSPLYSEGDIEQLLSRIEPNWEYEINEGAFSRPLNMGNWRLRVSACLANRGMSKKLSVRRTPVDPRPLDATGLPPAIKLMVEDQKGLALISGPTGAGKTSTMASLVDYINASRNAHIITIEDPIEFVFEAKRSIFTQREVGSDTPSFFEGVRSAMRQRPDVIVIGEIRDKATAENAILAGESGHLVIATMHANSVAGTIQKLVSYFPGEEASKYASLAVSLLGVINQSIIPQLDPELDGILASELLFNHEHLFSKHLADPGKLNQMLEFRDGVHSRSMLSCIYELVRSGKIGKDDAMKSVTGQGLTAKMLRDKLVYV